MRGVHLGAAAVTPQAVAASADPEAADRLGAGDAGLCFLLFAGTLLYIAYWPRDFFVFDEGLFLYESKRVLDGQVMYRDFFEIVTPGSFYVMAGAFALFGTTLETARALMAVVHGSICVSAYLLCRRLGVRSMLALLVALLHMTLGFPALTIASPHWMSTALVLALVLIVIRQPCTSGRRALLWGAMSGLLIVIQQQRGIIVAGGAGLMVLWDGLRIGGRPLLTRVAGFVVGGVAVVLPVLLAMVAAAGLDNVARALVLHPIRRYPRTSHGRGGWGTYVPGMHPLGVIISNLPLILPFGVAAALWQWRSGLAAPLRRPLVVAVVFAVTGLLSVSYNPNYVHFTMLAPLWFALAASLIELGLRRVSAPGGWLRPAASAVIVLLMLGAVWQLVDTLRTRGGWLPVRAQTAFGQVDFAHPDDVANLNWLKQFAGASGTDLFAYPACPGLYLLTGADNPTRFQIMIPDYTERDQLEEVVATLESRRVPYVVLGLYPGVAELEPLYSYVRDHYEPIQGPPSTRRPPYVVYQRRPETTAAGPM